MTREADVAGLVDRLRELLLVATPGPWAYRPYKHDDWGFIRGAETDSSIGRIRPPVAIAREGYPFSTGEKDHQHRLAGTDPYYHNAALIVETINALPTLLAALAAEPVAGDTSLDDPRVEPLAKALFLAEHPNSEWSAGRARIIWFERAATAIAALSHAAPTVAPEHFMSAWEPEGDAPAGEG